MIKDFNNYKNIKKLPNYIIYLNCKLIGKLLQLCESVELVEYVFCYSKNFYCKNYQYFKSNLLRDIIKDNKFFFNENLSCKTILYYNEFDDRYEQSGKKIIYCHYFLNEKKENIIIYLNNNILCYKNIETLEIVKRIKISNINLNLKNLRTDYLICCQIEYLLIYDYLGSFEVFKIYNNKSEKIFYIEKEKKGDDSFEENFNFNTIDYFNKKIYLTCFYKGKVYIYNIFLKQLEIIMDFKNDNW